MPELLNVIGTLLLAIVGLYLTHNFRRQIKQKTADSRMDAYAALWAITELARPTRLKGWKAETLQGPLTREEREELYTLLTHWYYHEGQGLYLGDTTRRIYLAAKNNLVCDEGDIEPEFLRDTLQALKTEDERHMTRGKWSIDQLSLLRARMRADLEVYGPLFVGPLEPEDKAFLEHCKEDWRKPPWSPARPRLKG